MLPCLKVDKLSKIFQSGWGPFKRDIYTAVDDISFHVNKGEILGFLGPNGAGKTTTIQMLLGTLTPSSGSISYFGSNFSTNSIKCLTKIGYASGFDKLPARLSVYENLDIVSRIYGLGHRQRFERIKQLLTDFAIWDIRDRQTGTLSAGQATRVLLAKAFAGYPEIVLLDEPTAALDPDVAQQVRKFILLQSEQFETSVLITSHNMNEVTELCDRVLVLKKGKIISDNTPEALSASISKIRINITLSQPLETAISYLQSQNYTFNINQHCITVEIDEHQIAQLLGQLAMRNINYSHISIDKPSLEDYFISIAK